jgi:hypothetical protein
VTLDLLLFTSARRIGICLKQNAPRSGGYYNTPGDLNYWKRNAKEAQ